MKQFIRARIAAGDTKSEIKAKLVAQFGAAVLAEPPKHGFNLLAWLLPLVGIVARRGGRSACWPGAGRARASRWRRSGAPRAARPGRSSAGVDEELRALRRESMAGRSRSRSLAGFVSIVAALRAAARPRLPVGGVRGRGAAPRRARGGAARRAREPALHRRLHGRVRRSSAPARRRSASVLDAATQTEIAGFILVVLGLAFMGLLPWPERAVGAGPARAGARRGSARCSAAPFAVCAAPCIGTVLATILVLAGDAGTVAARRRCCLPPTRSGSALAFLLAGVAFARAMGAFRWVRDHYRDPADRRRRRLLVALGLLLFFDRSTGGCASPSTGC